MSRNHALITFTLILAAFYAGMRHERARHRLDGYTRPDSPIRAPQFAPAGPEDAEPIDEPPVPMEATATVYAPTRPTLRDYFAAVRAVEGAGPNDFGDDGQSLGRYQIGDSYVYDSGVGCRWTDVRKERWAMLVMLGYALRYEPDALLDGDWETLARLHQGGCAWRRNPSERNDDYAKRVVALMEDGR